MEGILFSAMREELPLTKLLADETNITLLLLLRTQPLNCRKLSTILGKSEPQIARKLSQLERAGILRGEWIHRENNIKVYFLKIDKVQIHITKEGIAITCIPEKEEKVFAFDTIFQVNIPVAEKFIDREPQLALLDQSSFVVLTGIAGIGKTSLASFYAVRLKNSGKKIFWHTFSELDSVSFLVQKLAFFLSTYQYPQLLDYLKADGKDMRVIGTLLKECVHDEEFAFFFDDYHLVESEPMNHIFGQLKTSGGKICVISRFKPPFVSAFDSVVEVRLEEMEPATVQQFLESGGFCPDNETLRKIMEKIGGHPLALELLCQAATKDSFPPMEDVPSFEISSYLWDEIYSRLNPEEQKLLTVLSIFRGPVDITAVKMMCDVPNVRTVVNQLMKKNLIKRVDGKYLHHSVTRGFCMRLLHDAERFHQKAAEYYREQGTPKDILEAVYHFVEAHDYERGQDLIVIHHENLINEGYASILLPFCEKLDHLPPHGNTLMEIEGEIHLLQGEYDAALECFTICESGKMTPSLYRNLGEVYERKRDYKMAETLFLQGLSAAEGDSAERGTILVRLASVYAALSEPERALSCCEDALASFSRSEYKKGIAHVYRQMGEIFRFSDTEKALNLLFSSLEISQSIGDVQEVASTYTTIGIVLYERGRTNEGVTYFEKSLEISEQIGDILGIARCCNNIGVKYSTEYKLGNAMEYYFKTLSICERIGDKVGIAFSYSNLGRAYARLGVWEKALDYFFSSLKLREELSDKREVSYLQYNIGLTYKDMGNFQKALEWFEKSLKIREHVGYTLGVAHCCASMGEVLGEQGEFEKALLLIEKALQIHEQEKGAWMAACTRGFLAQVLVNKKEFEKAVELTEETVKILEEVRDIESLAKIHQAAAEAHSGLKDYEKAFIHAEAALEYARTMNCPGAEGRARRILGGILCEMGDMERAEDELRLSMRLLKQYTYELGKAYREFGLLCKRKGVPEKYEFLVQKAVNIFKEVGSDETAECHSIL